MTFSFLADPTRVDGAFLNLARDGRGTLGRIAGLHIVENCGYRRKKLGEGLRAQGHRKLGAFVEIVGHDAQVALRCGQRLRRRGRERPCRSDHDDTQQQQRAYGLQRSF